MVSFVVVCPQVLGHVETAPCLVITVGKITAQQILRFIHTTFNQIIEEVVRSRGALVQRFPVLSYRNRNAETLGSSLVIGLGTESQTFQVSESESEPEPKLRHSKSRNQNPNQNLMSLQFFLQLQALLDLKQPFLRKKGPF